jgi:hypothetical protein
MARVTNKQKFETALDLLNAVKQQIKLEPKTYNQLQWCTSDGTKSCGTQACVAGWIVAIHDGPRVLHVLNDLNDPNYDDPLHGSPVARRAAQLLGLTTIDTYDLFSADVDTNSNPGTREYARAGVRRINQFISDYGDHLKYNYS